MKRLACLTLAVLGLGVMEAADLVTEGWHHRVWAVYPVEKYKATDELPVSPPVKELRISAAKGERESFVILLRPNVPMREVQVEITGLTNGEKLTIDVKQATVRRMAYVNVDEPSGTRMKQAMPYPVGTGLYPDPLTSNKGDVRPAHNIQFLVTLHVPQDAQAGDYHGQVKLRYRKEPWMPATLTPEDAIPLVLQVRNFALPQRSSLLNTAYANLKTLPAALRTPEAIHTFQADFIQHRQTPEPLIPSPQIKVDGDGTLTVDSTAWEAAVEAMMAQGGSHLFIPVWGFYPEPAMAQGLYFLYHYPAVTNQKWMGAKICNEDRTLTDAFKKLFIPYLKHMHGVLVRRGWLERAFITTMDEPYTYHTGDRANDTPANNYEVIRNYVTLVRQAAPSLKTFCTADPAEGLNGYIDHWCLRNLDKASLARDRAEKHGEVFTYCDNYRSFIDYPAASARSFGWLAWKVGARGWLTYETLGAYDTAWESSSFTYPMFSGATVWGMGQMFYPDPASGAPLPSLRWELMRESCDDYEYLRLLADLTPKKSSAEGHALLEEARTAIVSGGGDAETMNSPANSNVTDMKVIHQLRNRIADQIERLSHP